MRFRSEKTLFRSKRRLPHPCRVLCGKGGTLYCQSRVAMSINGSLALRMIRQPDAAKVSPLAACPLPQEARKDGHPAYIKADRSKLVDGLKMLKRS